MSGNYLILYQNDLFRWKTIQLDRIQAEYAVNTESTQLDDITISQKIFQYTKKTAILKIFEFGFFTKYPRYVSNESWKILDVFQRATELTHGGVSEHFSFDKFDSRWIF